MCKWNSEKKKQTMLQKISINWIMKSRYFECKTFGMDINLRLRPIWKIDRSFPDVFTSSNAMDRLFVPIIQQLMVSSVTQRVTSLDAISSLVTGHLSRNFLLPCHDKLFQRRKKQSKFTYQEAFYTSKMAYKFTPMTRTFCCFVNINPTIERAKWFICVMHNLRAYL